jgi:hypothetical protein
VSNVVVSDNEAGGRMGTGLIWINDRSEPEIRNVLITRNVLSNGERLISLFAQNAPSRLRLSNVLIAGNPGAGVGIADDDQATLFATNVIIAGNDFADDAGGGFADGTVVDVRRGAVLTMSQSSIVGNHYVATGACGLVDLHDSTSSRLAGSLVVGNSAATRVAFCPSADRDAALASSGFWQNSPGDFQRAYNPIGTDGNISADPRFASLAGDDPLEWDLHLAADSPAVDSGDPEARDPDGSPSDMGAFGGTLLPLT